MAISRHCTIQLGVALLLWLSPGASAHLDAVRTSLPQLFMTADLVAIGKIDSIQVRSFATDKKTSRYEVVTASVASHYKGERLQRVEFFQYAHGHASYRPGDNAVLFLEALGAQHQLAAIARAGEIHYVSHQVRNTEHRLNAADLADYRAVLRSYAELAAAKSGMGLQSLSAIMLRMLHSDSPKLVESALLDWTTAGNSIEFSEADIDGFREIARSPVKPIGLRLALLREMSRRQLADETDWAWLLANESEENLALVLAALSGYENKSLQADLTAILTHPSTQLAESAARALGHPVYTGAETSLQHLLTANSQRLNYAAAQGLAGINSRRARTILVEAAARHPNDKVRRMISARLNLLG